MNVEEKERLIKKDLGSIENRVRHCFNQGYDLGIKENTNYKKSWNRLYNWLNDMRFAISPDETVTDAKDRDMRLIQVDLLDELMMWMEEQEEDNENTTM